MELKLAIFFILLAGIGGFMLGTCWISDSDDEGGDNDDG